METRTSDGTVRACGRCCTKLEHIGVTMGKNRILEDINLHFHCGELTALIGPNGAGKTTLIRALLGEVPHQGTLHFVDSRQQRQDRPVIGYVPQKLGFDLTAPLSVLDVFAGAISRWPVWMGCSAGQREKAGTALAAVDAGHLLNRKLGQLSGGELQKVLLALALTPIPDILLLDEPVSGIDLMGMELFYRMVSDLREQHDLSILLVSHDLPSVVQYADRIVFLNRTVICDGLPEQVLSEERLRRAFGVDQTLLKLRADTLHKRQPAAGRCCQEGGPADV
jgi:zinc transport system ATP-binding protein